MELATTYTPANIEQKWYKHWESTDCFKPIFKEGAAPYCIQLPPPNVTGTLHMGHGFQHTLMDALIRYHRMLGYNTLWQAGTDHAGIATQIVVERQLDAENISRHDLGREEFIKRIWQWKEQSGGTITGQMRRLGASCDWSRERFTMDEGMSKAVIEAFVRLYEHKDKSGKPDPLIYRGKRLVNWDVKLQTAVSDLEVISTEESGSMWHIRYPVKESKESVVVATTRPETMLGDVAVAVNPDDKRYKHLIGKTLLLPLVGREIKIIADAYVDLEFGTGCVKLTPAHDFNDYQLGKAHNLEMISIMALDGHINDNAPEKYRGLERFAARKQIVKDLEEQGFLVEIKPHKLMVPRGDRTNVVIEPMLTDQWFINMKSMADDGLELVAQGTVKFIPDNWKTTYDNWLTNIQDWCISRQLWWGHRIPAYYDENGKFYVARTKEEAIKQAGHNNLRQDDDVLDTWFSSALWSFSTLGWPDKTEELKAFLPSNVLVTGFDIIFFWVARMIMFTRELTDDKKVPFKEVYVTGLIQDAHGNKMSKSKGNIIDPLDLIDGISLEDLVTKRASNLMNPKQADAIAKQTKKDYPDGFQAFGADALRFTFAALATNGREIRFDIKRIEGSRNFCNKLWNATRFVLMNAETHKDLIRSGGNYCVGSISDVDQLALLNITKQLSAVDVWILQKLHVVILDVEQAFKTYRFDMLAQKLYEFVWNDYCDWYLELAKVNLQHTDDLVRGATINTLLEILECVLRLLHPLIPFITEELWQEVSEILKSRTTKSLMMADYPTNDLFKYGTLLSDGNPASDVKNLQDLISSVRNLRAEMNLNPGLKVPLVVENVGSGSISLEKFNEFIPYVQSLAKISEVCLVDNLVDTMAPIAHIAGIRIMLEVEIDKDAEKLRLGKELEKNTKDLEKIKVKLGNPSFVERAPKGLVERDTLKAKELEQTIKQLIEQLAKL